MITRHATSTVLRVKEAWDGSDGCIIEGEVENSVLFRGVKIAKGAKVRNCVLMQDTVVGEGCDLEYVITDKNVTISADKEIKGTNTFPVYVC